ncbi:MAG: tetratricopeptide repeat protein [Armatimonadetes bacterium]|nr:tetratricopeptide repeat protein [Akkermansiaceae bacterium]
MMIPDGSEIEPGFLLESARLLIDQGNTKDAEQQLKAAIRTFPKTSKTETAESMRLLAKIWIKEERNQDAAQALIQRAEALKPD